jgi:cytochrome P450
VDDDRVMSRFVEEVLRLEPPVHGLFRTNMKAVELSGVAIPALSQICILFASANDDEAEFPCPRTLDLNRPNLGHQMAFGAGIHRCIGAALARMEIKVAAQEVIRRLDDIQLAIPREEISYLPTLGTHTVERLPLRFRRR